MPSSSSTSDSSLDSKLNTSEIQKRFSNTTTDMMVNLIANSDKLVSTDARYNFNHSTTEHKPDTCVTTPKPTHHKTDEKKETQNQTDKPFEKTIFEQSITNTKKESELSSNELMLEKLNMIRKLGELSQQGVKLSQKYTINSELSVMKYEYELHTKIRAKKELIKWMGSGLLLLIKGMEMLSATYNPFDINLIGWHDQMNAEIGDYYDVFGQLYEDYFGKSGGKDLPVLVKLLGMIFFSGFMFHMGNKTASYITGQSKDENPALLEELRQQAMKKNIEQQKKNNSKLDKVMDLEHNLASQKAADINFLKEKELEFYREQQKNLEERTKQTKYEELKQQLKKQSSSSSDSESSKSQPLMQEPKISNNMRSIFGTTIAKPLAKSTQSLGTFANTLKKIKEQTESSSSVSSDSSTSKSSKSSKSSLGIVTLTANLDSILKTDAKPKREKKNDTSSNVTSTVVLDKKDISKHKPKRTPQAKKVARIL